MNCHEISLKNQYHKKISDSDEHDYQLLIHQLQPNSVLIPKAKTVLQMVREKLLFAPNKLNSTPTGSELHFSTFARIFAKCHDLVEKELSKPTRSATTMTVFMPTDLAFRSLRRDQIESLSADRMCAFKFVMQNIVFEEVCPEQLIRYNTEYSSRLQKADFIAVTDENDTQLYFNGQKVSTSKVYFGSNGFVFYL